MKKALLLLCCLFLGIFCAGNAFSAAIIKTGNVYLGVNDAGHLNVYSNLGVTTNSSYTGVTYAATGDATSPGCLCEGWGVSGNTTSAYASIDNGGIFNITVDSFASDGSTAAVGTYATSAVHMTSLPTLKVTQDYRAAAAAPGQLFQNTVTIANTSDATISDVRYTRVMDWDVPPTEFNEYVSIFGTNAANLLLSHDDGFSTPDPLESTDAIMAGTTNVDFYDAGPADHGAYFLFGFGDLLAGESITFSIFYGATDSERAAYAALAAVDAELASLGQSNGGQIDGTPATYIFGFSGVGGEIIVDPGEVPEPSTMLLLGIGALGLAGIRRFRKN